MSSDVENWLSEDFCTYIFISRIKLPEKEENVLRNDENSRDIERE